MHVKLCVFRDVNTKNVYFWFWCLKSNKLWIHVTSFLQPKSYLNLYNLKRLNMCDINQIQSILSSYLILDQYCRLHQRCTLQICACAVRNVKPQSVYRWVRRRTVSNDNNSYIAYPHIERSFILLFMICHALGSVSRVVQFLSTFGV